MRLNDPSLRIGAPSRLGYIILPFIFVFIVLSATELPGAKASSVVIVDGGGGGDVMTIGEGLGIVDVGGTLLVRPGLYNESVVVDIPVTIQGVPGPDGERPVIQGTGEGEIQLYNGSTWYDAVHVSADDVSLVGLVMTRGVSGVSIDGNRTVIMDSMATGNSMGMNASGAWGLYVERSSFDGNPGAGLYLGGVNGSTFRNVTIDGNGYVGASLFGCHDNLFENVSVSNNSGNGMHIYWLSNGNLLSDSHFDSNDNTGLYIMDSDWNTIEDSTMDRNGGSGLHLMAYHGVVSNSSSSGNAGVGMDLYHATRAFLRGNTITDNGLEGIKIRYSENAHILSNLVADNMIQVKVILSSTGSTIINNTILDIDATNPLAQDDVGGVWCSEGYGNYWSSSTVGNETARPVPGTAGSVDCAPLVSPPHPVYWFPIVHWSIDNGSIHLDASDSFVGPSGGDPPLVTWRVHDNGTWVDHTGLVVDHTLLGHYELNVTVSLIVDDQEVADGSLSIPVPEDTEDDGTDGGSDADDVDDFHPLPTVPFLVVLSVIKVLAVIRSR